MFSSFFTGFILFFLNIVCVFELAIRGVPFSQYTWHFTRVFFDTQLVSVSYFWPLYGPNGWMKTLDTSYVKPINFNWIWCKIINDFSAKILWVLQYLWPVTNFGASWLFYWLRPIPNLKLSNICRTKYDHDELIVCDMLLRLQYKYSSVHSSLQLLTSI